MALKALFVETFHLVEIHNSVTNGTVNSQLI